MITNTRLSKYLLRTVHPSHYDRFPLHLCKPFDFEDVHLPKISLRGRKKQKQIGHKHYLKKQLLKKYLKH